MDEGRARAVLLKAANYARCGDIECATSVLVEACMAGVDVNSSDRADYAAMSLEVTVEAVALAVSGAQLCAGVLRDKAGDPHPECGSDDRFYALRLATVDGDALPFEALHEGVSAATSLRCVSAALNADEHMLAGVLEAHLTTHGHASVFDIVGDLVKFYVLFSSGDLREEWATGE